MIWERKSVSSSQDAMIDDNPGEVLSIYVVRIACPKCSMEQTFRGTPSEIGVAVEAWNSKHQRVTHSDKPDAPTGTGRRSCTPSRIVSRASHPVRQESTATRARNGCPKQYPYAHQAALSDCHQHRVGSLHPEGQGSGPLAPRRPRVAWTDASYAG
jgi:hypothetical protein